MRTLRGAIVGYGRVAEEGHRPGFETTPGFRIVAVVDPSAPRRERAALAFGDARVVADLDELLESDLELDFVDVATPPRDHARAVVAALDRGWHALCEKPLAVARRDVDAVVAAARRSGGIVFTVHNWKHAPLLRRLRELAASGAIGRVRELEWIVERPHPPRGAAGGEGSWRTDPAAAGGGILVDHGWHAVYLATFLLGAAPRAVRARIWNERADLAVEDSAEVEIDFGHARASIALTWAAGERRTAGRLYGDAGKITIGDDVLEVRRADRAPERLSFAPGLGESSTHPEWFGPVLAEFRAEILHVERRGRNLAEAVCCAEVLDAAYASRGTMLDVPTREDLGSWLST